MSSLKEAIEEMIEESYLLNLSEEEIRQDFTRFIDTCYAVIHDHVKDRAIISGITEDLAREKTCILIADRLQGSEIALTDQGEGKSAHELFAGKVARRKRMILKTIGEYDPQLVRLIDERRFRAPVWEPHRPRFKLKKRRNWEPLRLLLLKIGYAATVVLIVALIYLGFVQK